MKIVPTYNGVYNNIIYSVNVKMLQNFVLVEVEITADCSTETNCCRRNTYCHCTGSINVCGLVLHVV